MTEPVSEDFLARVRGIRAKTEAATAEDLAEIGKLELGVAVAELTRRVATLERLLEETHVTVEQLVMWVTPLKGAGSGSGDAPRPEQQRPPTNDW